MARKAMNEQIDNQKAEEKIEPKKMDNPAPVKTVNRIYKIRINGSLTIWGQRYTGVVEWPENDPRLTCAKGDYELLEVIER